MSDTTQVDPFYYEELFLSTEANDNYVEESDQDEDSTESDWEDEQDEEDQPVQRTTTREKNNDGILIIIDESMSPFFLISILPA